MMNTQPVIHGQPRVPQQALTVVRNAATLATVPVTADYSARDWTDLARLLPAVRWTDVQDDDFSFAKQGETAGVTVTAKGARTMVLRTSVEREFDAADEDPTLLESALATAFPVAPVRCDSHELASMAERWYVVTPAGSKPVVVKYDFSSGNAGGFEGLTFQAGAELPKVGDEALAGTWSDRCSR